MNRLRCTSTFIKATESSPLQPSATRRRQGRFPSRGDLLFYEMRYVLPVLPGRPIANAE